MHVFEFPPSEFCKRRVSLLSRKLTWDIAPGCFLHTSICGHETTAQESSLLLAKLANDFGKCCQRLVDLGALFEALSAETTCCRCALAASQIDNILCNQMQSHELRALRAVHQLRHSDSADCRATLVHIAALERLQARRWSYVAIITTALTKRKMVCEREECSFILVSPT